LIRACERDFGQDPDYDFAGQLHCLRWFCIFLALNERRHLADRKERYRYCRELINDPVVRETKLGFGNLSVSFKQKLLMILIRLRAARLIAEIGL
jgi:hypothetical protein